MLRPGTPAPPFALPDQSGTSVSLADLLHRGQLILYFYPADFTPGCTREACFIRDQHVGLLRAGVTVAGVSPQSSASHVRFAQRHSLPFTLLADTEKTVARLYGVVAPFGLGVRRASFLIGRDGVIRDAIRADFSIAKHEDFFRRALAPDPPPRLRPR
jgi:thioredoxin-dependent peroxiredoxin